LNLREASQKIIYLMIIHIPVLHIPMGNPVHSALTTVNMFGRRGPMHIPSCTLSRGPECGVVRLSVRRVLSAAKGERAVSWPPQKTINRLVNSFSRDGFLHPKPPWNSGSNSRHRYRKLGLRWRLAPRNRGRKSGFSVALGVLATSLTARYVPCWQEARGHWAITRVRSSLFRDGWR